MSSFAEILRGGLVRVSAVAGSDVRYSRGASWVRVRAVPGHTDFTLSDQWGAVSEYRSRDFIVQGCSLKLGGTLVKPQRGDTISEGGNVYEVSRPDGGEQPWSFSDNGGNFYRIHTKLKGAP